MKKFVTKAAQTAKDSTVTVASKILGATHFVGYTVAEIAKEGEASLKLSAYGVDKNDTRKHRVMRTLEHQQFFIDKYQGTLRRVQMLRGKNFEEQVITISVHEIE